MREETSDRLSGWRASLQRLATIRTGVELGRRRKRNVLGVIASSASSRPTRWIPDINTLFVRIRPSRTLGSDSERNRKVRASSLHVNARTFHDAYEPFGTRVVNRERHRCWKDGSAAAPYPSSRDVCFLGSEEDERNSRSDFQTFLSSPLSPFGSKSGSDRTGVGQTPFL